jgi:hypothetical protein
MKLIERLGNAVAPRTTIQGRGEFVRLALEEARVDYVDVASVLSKGKGANRPEPAHCRPVRWVREPLLGEQGLRSSAELSDARVIRIVNARV